VQRLYVVLGHARRRAGLEGAAARVLRAGVQAALEVDDGPVGGGRRPVARADPVPLHLVVGGMWWWNMGKHISFKISDSLSFALKIYNQIKILRSVFFFKLALELADNEY